jgi:hypothetical protein
MSANPMVALKPGSRALEADARLKHQHRQDAVRAHLPELAGDRQAAARH